MADTSLLSRIPLRISVPLMLVTPVLLVAVVLTLIAYVQGSATARELTRGNLDQIHKRIEAHVDGLLDTPATPVAMNKALIEQGRLPIDDLPAWRDTIISQFHAQPILSSIVFGSADGRATWVCRYEGDDLHTYYAVNPPGDNTQLAEYRINAKAESSTQPTNTFPYDPRIRPWYKAPTEAGKATWCEPFVFVGGADAESVTLGISYAEPLFDSQGKQLGVVDADLSLNDISHYLARLKIGEWGQVYITDCDGLIIGSSMGAKLADDSGERISATKSEHAWVRVSADYIGHAFKSLHSIQSRYEKTIDIEGHRFLLVCSPYEHPTGISWMIVTLVPESDFLAGVQAARQRGLIIAVVASLLTLLLGIAAAMWMVRPMMQLNQHVRRIGEGDLDQEIHLNQSPELIKLSNEINEMTAGLRDRMRMRHSLAVAMDVQQALLPDGSPKVKGVDIAGHSTYCDETGGDYYDFLDITGLEESSVCVALGDVMGHGVAAAMLMATARGILRSHSSEPRSLADLLCHLNELLVPDTGGKRFMTMLLATLDAKNRVLRWASAGHEPPFYYDPQSGVYHELDGSGLPLGIMQEEVYEEYTFDDVREGQVFFMATDGVWEMQNPDGEQFGKQRVRELIESHHTESAEQISRHIRDALIAFRGDDSRDDDVTFVILRVMSVG